MGYIEREFKTYAKILSSDGTLRIPTNEDDPKVVKRIVERQDGSKKTYFEQVKQGYQGKIESINFKEMDFGTMINITFFLEEGQDNQFVLSMNTSSKFAMDFMEKLPNIDLSKKISLAPWAMEKDNGRVSKGMTIWQTPKDAEEGSAKVKVQSFFKEYEEGKNIPNLLHGFPEAKDSSGNQLLKGDKDGWKIYFMQVKKFLIKYTEDNIIPNLIFDISKAEKEPVETQSSEREINPDDIPM